MFGFNFCFVSVLFLFLIFYCSCSIIIIIVVLLAVTYATVAAIAKPAYDIIAVLKIKTVDLIIPHRSLYKLMIVITVFCVVYKIFGQLFYLF